MCQPAQDIALGKYGAAPGPIDPQVLAQVEKQTGKKPVTERPADLLPPGMEGYRKQCADRGLPTDDETVVLFAMFPQQIEALIKGVPAAATGGIARTCTCACNEARHACAFKRQWQGQADGAHGERQTPRSQRRNAGELS